MRDLGARARAAGGFGPRTVIPVVMDGDPVWANAEVDRAGLLRGGLIFLSPCGHAIFGPGGIG